MPQGTMRGDLRGRVIVVTGALGIVGNAVTRKLLEEGALVCSLDIHSLHEAAEFASNKNFRHFRCDVTSAKEVNETVSFIEANVGPIQGLHNNAATKTSDIKKFFESLENYEEETWNEVLRTNVFGMFLVARSVGTCMALRGSGAIVQTASIYGASMGPDQRIYEGSSYLGTQINTPVSYTVSKAAVHGLTNHLATYWGSSGVRVNTVTPGGMRSGQNDIFESRYSQRVPLGRMGEASELADAVRFLLSDDSSYVTGANLFVDGGLHAW